ncbi:MAG: hypothetical protein P8J50_10085 [Acidimicrobiales bacterium]|jgi:hypothetical protein|nr:hypothetical protein [Acidimicrobiales bacterium]
MTVAIDCDSSEPVGETIPAAITTPHPSGLTYVRWTTGSGWGGCRRLLLTFSDGSTLAGDVTMLVPIP